MITLPGAIGGMPFASCGVSPYGGLVRLPLVNHTVNLSIKGKTHPVTCIDLFDGGYGYYFDAVFSKKTRYKFSVGEQCGIPELGEKCIADFVSYPTGENWKVRFLIPKWS